MAILLSPHPTRVPTASPGGSSAEAQRPSPGGWPGALACGLVTQGPQRLRAGLWGASFTAPTSPSWSP